MGNKQEIGKLFENKLNNGKKKPSTNLWEKVNTTLEAEKRRRKRVLYYWFLGGGLTVLLGLFLFNNSQNSTPEQKNNNLIVAQPNITSEKESTENSIVISKKDSLYNNNIETEEKLSKIDLSTKISEQNENENPVTENINKQRIESEKEKTSSKILNENYTVSKNYYYYNSKDGKQLITTSKREIDSLIIEGHKTIDSLTTKKIDSIH